MIGNKSDLLDSKNEVNEEELDKYCHDKGFIKWFITSAKISSKEIEDAAKYLVEKILEHQDIFQKKNPPQVSLFHNNCYYMLAMF